MAQEPVDLVLLDGAPAVQKGCAMVLLSLGCFRALVGASVQPGSPAGCCHNIRGFPGSSQFIALFPTSLLLTVFVSATVCHWLMLSLAFLRAFRTFRLLNQNTCRAVACCCEVRSSTSVVCPPPLPRVSRDLIAPPRWSPAFQALLKVQNKKEAAMFSRMFRPTATKAVAPAATAANGTGDVVMADVPPTAHEVAVEAEIATEEEAPAAEAKAVAAEAGPEAAVVA